MVARKVDIGLHIPCERGLRYVLGNVDQDHARAARGSDVIGLASDFGKIVGFFHQEIVLHARHGDAENVSLLESVFAEHPGDLLTA